MCLSLKYLHVTIPLAPLAETCSESDFDFLQRTLVCCLLGGFGARLYQLDEHVCRHIYSVSPAVIFPLYSDRRQIKGEATMGELHFGGGECQSGRRVAAVDSPRDGSSPSLSAKYLITPADTRRARGKCSPE